jgi:hypothetical protein
VTNEPYAVHAEAVDGRAEITDLSNVDETPDFSQAHNSQVYATIIRADGSTEDVGLIGASYTGRWQTLKWKLFGKRAADRRIRRINRRHAEKEQ